MKTILLSLLAAMTTANLGAQEPRVITKQQAVEDFAYLIKTIEEVHPNIYFSFPKDAAMSARDSIIGQLPDTMTTIEFAKSIVPFSNRFCDGHTRIGLPVSDSVKVLPITVRLINNRLYIDTILFESAASCLHHGDEIVTVNGKTVAEIIDLALPYIGGEQDKMKRLGLEMEFGRAVNGLFGEEVTLILKRSGELLTVNDVPLISRKTLRDNIPAMNNYSFRFIDNNTGYLEFNHQHGYTKKEFAKFLKNTFGQTQQHNCQNLIVDLRKNSGGNSMFGDMLISYITDAPYRAHQKYYLKTSGLLKTMARRYFVKWYMYPIYPFLAINELARGVLFKKNGTITALSVKETKPELVANKFRGNVFILTSVVTYSAAATFLAPVKYYKMATIIGDTIGQPYAGYIDMLPFQLPHSGVRGGVSWKYYEYIGADEENKHHGIAPDIAVKDTTLEGDDVLEYAINYIKGKK